MTQKEKLIYEWSPSKLERILACPLWFWFETVEQRRPPVVPVIRVVGQALHYMAKDFFERTFLSAETFAGAWTGFWQGVVNGEHGPEGWTRPPVAIAWKDKKDESDHWMGRGIKITRDFFERNAPLRDVNPESILLEQAYHVDWRGFRLTGRWDRAQLIANGDGVVLYDYKMRRFGDHELLSLLQGMFYTIAYNEYFRWHVFDGKPLLGMRLETLGTWGSQAYQDIPLPTEGDRLLLLDYLIAASSYLWALTKHKTLPPSSRPRFTHFPTDFDGNPVLWPRLPRGNHCDYCDFKSECVVWVEQRLQSGPTSARVQLHEHLAAERAARHAQQCRLELVA